MAYYFSPLGNGVAFVDSNGNPLSGAKLFTYTAGSTTKSTVYQTNTGTAHSNPITLDANGRPPAAIWLEGGRSYKFVLAPSNDTDPPTAAIYTWDNVSGINDTTVSVDQWVAGPTPTFVDADTFTLVGDQSSTFHVNRRLKLTVSGGTRYGYVSAVAYTTLTTVDVVLDSGTLDSGLSAVSYALLSATNQSYPRNVATTDTAQTISGANTFTADQTFQSTDAGAAAGPNVILDRNSASPAVADVLGAIPFQGRDSVAGTDTYAQIQAEIVDPTSTSEDGELAFLTAVAGALAKRGYIRNGLVVGSAVGGDKGAGTVNADMFYRNGTQYGMTALVQTQYVSAGTGVTFASLTAETYYILRFRLIKSNAAVLHARVNNDSTANRHGVPGDAARTYVDLDSTATTTGDFTFGTVEFCTRPGDDLETNLVIHSARSGDGTTVVENISTTGKYNGNALTSIHIFPGSGTITGWLSLYAIGQS